MRYEYTKESNHKAKHQKFQKRQLEDTAGKRPSINEASDGLATKEQTFKDVSMPSTDRHRRVGVFFIDVAPNSQVTKLRTIRLAMKTVLILSKDIQ